MNVKITNFRTVIAVLVPTLDTNAYASGDVLFDRAVLDVSGWAPGKGGQLRGRLVSVRVLDKDGQGAAMDLWLLRKDVSLGTVNAAPSITDADAENLVGYISILPSKNLGGCKFGQADCDLRFDLTSSQLYLAAVVNGAPTHTAAGLRIVLAFELEGGGI